MMRWRGGATTAGGVVERSFEVRAGAGPVPGIVWTPEGAREPVPLVLLGYGGGGHMRDGSRLWQAGWFARQHGIAAASIDLLGHGERALAGGARPDYGLLVDDAVAEWQAALDLLVQLPAIDAQRVAYRGTSLGTMLGLPFVAAEPRVRAATLGLADLREVAGLASGIGARLARDAPAVRCAVLFLVQWDDEIVDRESAFRLFDLLGAADKELRAYPGRHADTPQHATEAGMHFLVEHLTAR